MNSYEQRQEARRQRLEARAAKLHREGTAKVESGFERLRAIPFGQPILVGHHSEKRDRNYRRKAGASIDRGMEMRQQAGELTARAAAVGTGGISSDDPEAVQKLQAELTSLQERQSAMKAANDTWRKAGNKAGRHPSGEWVEAPYAPYQLSNNSANIRRIEQRIEQLKAAATRETKEEAIGNTGVKIIQNAEANRIQLVFPGKPSDEIRSKLKSFGFRWSPTEGAWQRHLNGSGIAAAQSIANFLQEVA